MFKNIPFKRTMLASMLTLASGAVTVAHAADAAAPKQDAKKPNIVVIFGDDIGYLNLSTYNQGLMGYQTPNIDSIAAQGAKFTSYYAEQSSTAGRSAFITGQMPFRTGMSKVGMPGRRRVCRKKIRPSPTSSSSWVTPPASLVKPRAIVMNSCRPRTVSMNSWQPVSPEC